MVSTGISGSTTRAAASQARWRSSASRRGSRHHVAPGKVRCSDCSSLRRWPRCSLCRPTRPPCCIQSFCGSVSVASATTPVTRLQPLRLRKLAGSMAMPASISARSPSSTANISPVKAQRSSIAACARRVALLGAVAEPDDPFGGMAQMIGAFLLATWRRSRPASHRSTPSSRASRDRRRRNRRTAAPWCGRNRRSAARPAADCGTA